ncbi:MlaE family ABC transporter permease [Candidatus Deianiraea vastatrix]|uniref:ABC transporter permease n=1 Tax=Candidatus Deianiraea vastatrix TaxID=2163644 RepID=A0A5B8XI48_9RICK|nr:ABC transporter permease [Candidatus Deianiraea vastatrix]QED23701.1 Putative ABC transporter permease [Candidatus Deianiraea vastatrix]
MNFLSQIGQKTISLAQKLGFFSIFAFNIFKYGLKRPFFAKIFAIECFHIGYLTLPVIGLTAIFTGGVLALQSYSGFSRFNAESSIPIVVALSITRELAPVLGGLMFAARVGSSISAKIGTMSVTEQINAMKTLSVNPIQYIIFPKVLAGLICLPILTLVADIIGIYGGFLTSVHYLNFSPAIYIKNTTSFLTNWDVISGLIKALVFGLMITIISCFNGYFASNGAEGVGKSVINSVVTSAIIVLAANYIITSIIF